MKKVAYLLLAVTLIGGVAYVLTQTSLLKGNFDGSFGMKPQIPEGAVEPTEPIRVETVTVEEKVNFSIKDISYDEKSDLFQITVCSENIQDPNFDSSIATMLSVSSKDVTYEIGLAGFNGVCGISSIDETVTKSYSIDPTVAGSYTITATIDAAGSHKESNEIDNVLSKEIVFKGTTIEGSTIEEPVAEESVEEEIIEEEDTASSESIYTCNELKIVNDRNEEPYVLKEGKNVGFTVEVEISEPTSSIWDSIFGTASLLGFTLIAPETSTTETSTTEILDTSIRSTGGTYTISVPWEGTLVIEAERMVAGEGAFIDTYTGKEGKTLEVPINYYDTSYDFIYSAGTPGDVIYAYIKEEPDCGDKLELIKKASAAPIADEAESTVEEETTVPEEVSYACSAVDIQPDSYTLPSDENAVEFAVTVTSAKSTSMTSWTRDLTAFIVNILSFNTIDLASDEEWSGKLVVESYESDAVTYTDGVFQNDINSDAGNPITVTLSGESNTVNVTYKNGAADDTIVAYISGEENCRDTLTLEAEEIAVEEEELVAEENLITEEEVLEDEDEDEDAEEEELVAEEEIAEETVVATTTSNDWNTILTSKEYICSEPFIDADESDWFWGKTCRLYRAGVFTGIDYDNVAPEQNLTRAEAVKVLMILSGRTASDATGKTENYSDVAPTDWHYPYFVLAQEAGVVRGNYANPNAAITRGDWMTLMVRMVAFDTAGAEGTLYGWDEDDIPFSDLKKSDYYTYAIIIAYNTIVEDPDTGTTRVFEGYSNGTSGATKYIARSEAMTLALRFYLAWYAN